MHIPEENIFNFIQIFISPTIKSSIQRQRKASKAVLQRILATVAREISYKDITLVQNILANLHLCVEV